MKSIRKLVLVVSVALVLTLFLGSWISTSAAFITDDTWAIGRQGIFIPGGFSMDNVKLTRVGKEQGGKSPVAFTRPLLRLEYFNNEGSSIGIPFAMTYVFYNLHGFEVKDWEEGRLDLWYRDNTDGSWKRCNAFQTKLQNGDARIGCVATQATLFGLGRAR